MLMVLLSLPVFAQGMDDALPTVEMPDQQTDYWRRPPPPPPPRLRHSPPPRPVHHEAQKTPVDSSVTLTVGTSVLTSPLVEFAGEFRVAPKAGISLLGGIGGYNGTPTWALGGEARAYLAGSFSRGVFIGLDGRYTNALVPGYYDGAVALGPVLGGKYTFDTPLALEAKISASWVQGDNWAAVAPACTVAIGLAF